MACETKRNCLKCNADLMCIAFNFDADMIMLICVCGMNTLIVCITHAVLSADEISANTLLCLRLHYLFMERRRGIKRFNLCTISFRSVQFSLIFFFI